MALNITINKVSVAASFAAGATVATAVASGGTAPYVYSLATGGDKFAINSSTGVVTTIAAMDITNIASFSVTATDSTTGTALTITSDVIYPPIQAAIRSKFDRTNVIYKITKDIDLGHGVLTIPEGCTLDFQGGSFTDGTIVGNNTKIKSDLSQIFKSIIVSGTWKSEESSPIWFGADNTATIDSTIAFQSSIKLLASYGGTLRIPNGGFLVKNLSINKIGIKVKGNGPTSSYIIGRGITDTDYCIYCKPLIGGNPYTALGYGNYTFEDIQVLGDDDISRDNGIGIKFENCFNYSLNNSRVCGFKKNIDVAGSHYLQLINCYLADEKFNNGYPSGYPNVETFNRGYGIYVEDGIFGGETESNGISIKGGIIHNTALWFKNANQVHLQDLDIEPASNTVVIKSFSCFENCRFERFDLYALNGKYAKFPWFSVEGNSNTFVNNTFYTVGENNLSSSNPIFQVKGKNNKFFFGTQTPVVGTLAYTNTAEDNYVEFRGFSPQVFTTKPLYMDESAGLFKGGPNNVVKYTMFNSEVTNYGKTLEIKNASRIRFLNYDSIGAEGATLSGNTYTLTATSGRLIFNHNATATYVPNDVYIVAYKLKFSSPMNTWLNPNYTSTGYFSNGSNINQEVFITARFKVTADNVTIRPSLNWAGGTIGETFEIQDLQIIHLDGNENIDNQYIKTSIFFPHFEAGKTIYNTTTKKMELWNGTAWVNMDGTDLA